MASFLAPRVAAGPGSFIPQNGHRLGSPFDPSTSTALQESSDCGSSSGVGGMKTQELVSSDEGGDSSSAGHSEQVPPFYAMPPPPPRIPLMPHGPPTAMGPMQGMGPPLFPHPPPPGVNSDLFVHVQAGETLSMLVGNEVQHIAGPATVRMVGELGIAPSALPLHVPPGHQIHQIIDEQGILRHVILSPETYPPGGRCPPQTMNGMGRIHATSPPPLMGCPPPLHPNFYTVNRKWNGGHAQPMVPKHLMHTPEMIPPMIIQDEQMQDLQEVADMDSEEWDRVKEMLTRIQAPQILRITNSEVDLAWQELDTSEAAAPGGPFPQIDASEFTYQIMLYENIHNPRFVSSYRCEPTSGNKLRLCRLRPHTDYYVQLKASLEERGLHGEPSQPVPFKTLPGTPDAPVIKVDARGHDHVIVSWKEPLDNGNSIGSYNVYLCKEDDAKSKKVYEGRDSRCRVTNLSPGTSYRLRVSASNRVGESAESAPVGVVTKTEGPPSQPPPPGLVSINLRSVKLSWTALMEHTYTLEMQDISNDMGPIIVIKEKALAASALINDLVPGSELRFRLTAHNSEGDSKKSEWAKIKVPGGRHDRSEKISGYRNRPDCERVLVPTKPFVVNNGKSKKLEIAWKVPGARDREFSFHVEGATEPISPNAPPKWRTLYRGFAPSLIVTEDNLVMFRVQAITKKQSHSDWSEVLTLPSIAMETLKKPSQLGAPQLQIASKSTVGVSWTKNIDFKPPLSATWMYELRNVEACEVVYAGQDTKFTLDNLLPEQAVDMQVRIVLIDSNGIRVEGEWSSSAKAITLRDIPQTPGRISINEEMHRLEWEPVIDKGIMYRIKRWTIEDDERVSEKIMETEDNFMPLGDLEYAMHYQLTVACFHEGGESIPSHPVDLTTSAGVPNNIDGVTVEAESTSELLLKWETPDCCGAEIKQYHLKIECDGEFIRECAIVSHGHGECERKIGDLEPNTLYTIRLAAENEMGFSDEVEISGKTRCPPPQPPSLECEAEPTFMKLRWKYPNPTATTLKYRVVRVTDTDGHVVVYDGEASTTRVKGLMESTTYRFQIRASDRSTGSGPWSEVFEFRTPLSPPPPMKTVPTAIATGAGTYQVEWANVIGKPNTRKLYYRLELLDNTTDGAEWRNIYEGTATLFILRMIDYSTSIQVRVRCGRADPCGNPLTSAPTPSLFLTNSSAVVKETKNDEKPVRPTAIQSAVKFIVDRTFATLIVILFIVFSFTMAVFMESVFDGAETSSPSPMHVHIPIRKRPDL